jgi:tRNA pseudouridine38-40 synthase
MARYQVILAYDGTGFAGSQRQAKHRTVQGELETALGRIGWRGRTVILAGRTDSGVHAAGQVAAFDLDWQHTEIELRNALNASLPADLAVCTVNAVFDKFHPRFDATSRRYRYRLFCQDVRDPLRERYAWRVWPAVDGDALASLAALWIGTHDFAAFGSPPRPDSSTVRTVFQSRWQQVGDEWQYDVQADAFLYRMVRRLVFVQVAAARGRLSAQDLARGLAGQAKVPDGTAPAHGLALMEVTYMPVQGKSSSFIQ